MKTKPRAPRQSAKPPTRQAVRQAPAKPRGAKGHFFTAPISPSRAPASVSKPAQSQRARPASPTPSNEPPLNAAPRGTKVRSRRPTGAQELRAQRLWQEAQHKQAAAVAQATTRPANRSATRPAPRAAATPQRASAPTIDFHLTGDYIALDNLLKLTGTAPSGGAAKALAASGAVRVDRIVELRKTCKIRAGQLVETADARIRVRAVAPAAAADNNAA